MTGVCADVSNGFPKFAVILLYMIEASHEKPCVNGGYPLLAVNLWWTRLCLKCGRGSQCHMSCLQQVV